MAAHSVAVLHAVSSCVSRAWLN
ncbi:hypothetical protein DPEC_G00302150 [Dallia pectoralis]|uniref:Uncharacterized protein n=1 Tax=Dallia pectoralis TaxID=75939 RepID=A0ACC2FGY9_DALPE|nr:hypothetical protein DPEC_G00302150 [Dallia pectoralis]